MTRVIAVNVSLNFIEAFDSVEAVARRCPGLEIAEGDWLFFGDNGDALVVECLERPRIDTDKGHYTDGRYRLQRSSGKTLQQWLFDRCREKDFWFGTLEDFERRFT